jgi:tetratricopeptide (TPR) repeat protein
MEENEPLDSRYRDIADLFGLTPAVAPTELLEPKARRAPNTAEGSDELGRESLAAGDYETAIKHFQKAVQMRKAEDVSSRVELAAAMEYADQLPQAWRQYLLAAKLRADEPEPFVGLSALLKRYGRNREAVAHLRKAIELEPENAAHHMRLAELLLDMGERKKALVAAMGAVHAAPDNSYYHFWIGDLLIEMKRYDEALDSLRAAVELSPGDDYLFLRTSVAFWSAGRYPEAIKAVRLASDLDPAKNLYHGLLAVLLKETGMGPEAELEQARAIRMDRYDREALRRLLVEMGLGKLAGPPA